MASERWHRGNLDKLTREQLLERLVDLELRVDAAEEYFLFGAEGRSKGRKGERAEEALYLIRPALRHTSAAPQSSQIFWDVWLALRDGMERIAAFEQVAQQHGIGSASVKATYYKHRGPDGLPDPRKLPPLK